MTDKDFTELAAEAGCVLGEKETVCFNKYYEMLIEKNKLMNLTAITDYDDVLVKHFVDSLLIYKTTDKLDILNNDESIDFNRVKLIDVGTGAGFPGIPLKICNPDMTVHLLDSLNKRIGFLNEVIDALDLKNTDAIHGRSEDFGRDKEFREQYDIAVSRAVADLSVLSEYCIPFVKVGGYFVSYKGDNASEEIKTAEKAVKLLGGEVSDILKVPLPGADAVRTFVMIKKVRSTPGKYPRKAGTPAKTPLR